MTSATGPLDPTGPPRPTGSSSWPGPGTAPGPTAVHPDDADGVRPAEPARPPHDHAHVAPAPPRRRRPWAVVVLSVLLVLVTALSAYLWVRTVRYEEYAQDVEDQARTIGTELATLRTEHEGTVGELAAVNDQLATAQTRITELADEKAQVGDDREVQRQLVDYQQRVSQAAANVASALSTCIEAQNQLITYLEDAAAYDPADLARFKGDVQGVCAVATEANTELQRQLAAGATG
ncbi:hypothetical protein [Cellulomonas endometrii]|uniref:hypothetical protein n=1 Tax=Cellulomonas endometrii TaxID=3036301 RepID=UPI0024ACE078|nr:hypothetical protein [Cellulomonas endometrii]